MAITHTRTIDTNAYVDEQPGYGTNKVRVDLDGSTFNVQAYPAGEYGTKLGEYLVNKTLGDLGSAIKYYEGIIRQLEQGDVIRNV